MSMEQSQQQPQVPTNDRVYYNYGERQIDLKHYIHNLKSNLNGYLASRHDWSEGQKQAFKNKFDLFSQSLEEQITGGNRFYTDYNGLTQDTQGVFGNGIDIMYGGNAPFDVGQQIGIYANQIGDAIINAGFTKDYYEARYQQQLQAAERQRAREARRAAGETREGGSEGKGTAFDPNTQNFLSYLKTDQQLYDAATGQFNWSGVYSLDLSDPTSFSNRTTALANRLKAYYDEVSKAAVDFSGTSFGTKDKYLQALKDAYDSLAQGYDPTNTAALNAIGLDDSFLNSWFSQVSPEEQTALAKMDQAAAALQATLEVEPADLSRAFTSDRALPLANDQDFGVSTLPEALNKLALVAGQKVPNHNDQEGVKNFIENIQKTIINGLLKGEKETPTKLIKGLLAYDKVFNKATNSEGMGTFVKGPDGRYYLDYRNPDFKVVVVYDGEKVYLQNLKDSETSPVYQSILEKMIPSSRLGGKFLDGGELAQMNHEAALQMQGDTSPEAFDHGQARFGWNTAGSTLSTTNGDWEYEDYARIGALATNIASMFMDPATGAFVGVGATAMDLSADLADKSVSAWDTGKHLAMNLGMDALAIIPGLESIKIANSIRKSASSLMKGLAIYGVIDGVANGKEIINGITNIAKGDYSRKDLDYAAQGVMLLATAFQAGKGKFKKSQAIKAKPEEIGIKVTKNGKEPRDIIIEGDAAVKIRELRDKNDADGINKILETIPGLGSEYKVNVVNKLMPIGVQSPVSLSKGFQKPIYRRVSVDVWESVNGYNSKLFETRAAGAERYSSRPGPETPAEASRTTAPEGEAAVAEGATEAPVRTVPEPKEGMAYFQDKDGHIIELPEKSLHPEEPGVVKSDEPTSYIRHKSDGTYETVTPEKWERIPDDWKRVDINDAGEVVARPAEETAPKIIRELRAEDSTSLEGYLDQYDKLNTLGSIKNESETKRSGLRTLSEEGRLAYTSKKDAEATINEIKEEVSVYRSLLEEEIKGASFKHSQIGDATSLGGLHTKLRECAKNRELLSDKIEAINKKFDNSKLTSSEKADLRKQLDELWEEEKALRRDESLIQELIGKYRGYAYSNHRKDERNSAEEVSVNSEAKSQEIRQKISDLLSTDTGLKSFRKALLGDGLLIENAAGEQTLLKASEKAVNDIIKKFALINKKGGILYAAGGANVSGTPSGVGHVKGKDLAWNAEIGNTTWNRLKQLIAANSKNYHLINEMQTSHAQLSKAAQGHWNVNQSYVGVDNAVRNYQERYKNFSWDGITVNWNNEGGIRDYYSSRYVFPEGNTSARSGDSSTQNWNTDNYYAAITDDRRLLGRTGDYSQADITEKNNWLKNYNLELYLDTDSYYKLRELAQNPNPANPQDPEDLEDPENPQDQTAMGGDATPLVFARASQSPIDRLRNKIPQLSEFLRVNWLNKRTDDLIKIAKEGDTPYLQEPYEVNRFVYGDYLAQQEGRAAAAKINSQMSRPLTSDGQLQTASWLEGIIKGQYFINQGNKIDNATIRETQEKAYTSAEKNALNANTILNANLKELNRNWHNLKTLDQAALSQKTSNISTYWSKLNDAAAKRFNALDLATKKADLQDAMAAAIANPQAFGLKFTGEERRIMGKVLSGESLANDAERTTYAGVRSRLQNLQFQLVRYYSDLPTSPYSDLLLSQNTYKPTVTTADSGHSHDNYDLLGGAAYKEGGQITVAKIKSKIKAAERQQKNIFKQIDSLDKKMDRISKNMRGPGNQSKLK